MEISIQMDRQGRAKPGFSVSDKERVALEDLRKFPLLDAIYGRRSRRFPLGGTIPAGPLAYKSRHAPVPLTELERLLLLGTMGGVTGWHFAITHHARYAPAFPNYAGSAVGRTFPSAAGFHTTELFFTDDSGTYYFPTRDLHPRVEPADLEAWLGWLYTQIRRLSSSRVHIPRAEPYMEGHNTWIANHPGSLLVIPIADIAQHTIANLAFFAQNGYCIYDDINGERIAGLEKFGHLVRVDEPLPLSFLEQYSLTEATAELATCAYNGTLLLQAMGLGGWMFDGIDRLTMLGASGDPNVPGLKFRYDQDPRWAFPNATGLVGVFEAFCRPHFPNMAAAIEAYAERKFGPGGPYHPDTPGPWTESSLVRGAAAPYTSEFKALLALQAAHIDERFGKFPGTVPTLFIMNYVQAQHIDLEFYDALFQAGAYLPTHSSHFQRWH